MDLRKLGKKLKKLKFDAIIDFYSIRDNGCEFHYLGVKFRCHCEQYIQHNPSPIDKKDNIIIDGPMTFYVNDNYVSYWEITDKKNILKIEIIP